MIPISPRLAVSLAAAGVIAAMSAGLWWQGSALSSVRDALAETKRGHAAQIESLQAIATAAATASASESKRRIAAQQETTREATARTASAESDRRGAVDAAGRLRDYAATLAASCGGAAVDPAAVASSDAASAPGTVLTYMQRRIAEVAGELAAESDRRGIAGTACQREYSALTGGA